jgi:cellulose biosynthesis protein BcsQ
MKTLAIYNLKGGVGKTAAAVNLASLAAAGGLATVLWDLDPQGAASWYLHGDAARSPDKSLWTGREPLGRLIRDTPLSNLQLIPADQDSRHLDVWLRKDGLAQAALSQRLKPLAEQAALVVLDCPPSLSYLADNIFAAADLILVPVVPTHLSLRALKTLIDYFKDHDLPRARLKPFWSMADRRRLLHRALIEKPPKTMRDVCAAVIPYASAIEKMGEHRAPLEAYEPSAPAAKAYRALWAEISPALKRP